MSPFRSAAQRRFMSARMPSVARRWAGKYGAKVGGGKTKAQKQKRKRKR